MYEGIQFSVCCQIQDSFSTETVVPVKQDVQVVRQTTLLFISKMIFLEVIDGFQTFPETMGVCGDQLR